MDGLVTVIVPVYCVEEIILKRCIESILEQTYKNLEVYLIDDGSPDNSGIICDIYAQKDNRIIVEHLENGGVSKARNHALGMAKGNYIMFVDSDDYIDPKCVEELLHCMMDNNADCTICATNYVDEKGKVDKGKSVIKKTKILGQKEALDALFYLKQIFDGYEMGAVWGCLYKHELIKNIRFDEKMKIGEDFVFKFYALQNASKVACVNLKYYNYLIRKESVMHNGFDLGKFESVERLSDLVTRNKNESFEPGIISRAINISIVILLMIPINDRSLAIYRKKIIGFIKKYRWSVIMNRKSRIKVKGFLVLSYFGFNNAQRVYGVISGE